MPSKKGTKKTTSKKPSAKVPKFVEPKLSKDPLPSRIFAQVSPRSVGGVSMFDAQWQINSETVSNFFSEGEAVNAAVAYLQEAGFEILQISPLTINIAGSAATYRKAFNTDVVVMDLPVVKELGKEAVGQFIDCPETGTLGLIETTNTRFESVIEGVAFEEKRYPMAPSMFAPLKSYWHLRVPGDVSLGCNADRAHRAAITGRGVKVAMVDSGHFRHPFFTGRGYNVAPVVLGPATANPLADESGHGTGESANIFAVAPDVQLLPVKINFVNSVGAFNAAVGLQPDIITCSWGSDKQFGPLSAADQALATAVAAAVASGIVVIFSAGNGHFGFPGQHPDVISAGGVFMNPDESLRASDYASGFLSNIFPNRRVPDVSGLVGMQPKAIYIMLPLEPGDGIDVGNAGGTHPGQAGLNGGDETANNDGWAAFSGTSAAAPQLAGAAALIKQACPKLKPAAVRDILMKTARDVTTGNCSTRTGGHAATAGHDLATGTGLVDAHKATLMAKLQCLSIIPPIGIVPPLPVPPPIPPPTPIIGPQPIEPVKPITPVGPQPIQPVKPITPVGPQPIQPVQPIKPPIEPVKPIEPIKPIAPIVNPGPVTPASQSQEMEAGEASPESQLTPEMVDALSNMIINSELE